MKSENVHNKCAFPQIPQTYFFFFPFQSNTHVNLSMCCITINRISSRALKLQIQTMKCLCWSRFFVSYVDYFQITFLTIIFSSSNILWTPWKMSLYALQVFDGYDMTAPLLNHICGYSLPDPISSTSNVMYIKISYEGVRVGSKFLLEWLQIPKTKSPPSKNSMSRLTLTLFFL